MAEVSKGWTMTDFLSKTTYELTEDDLRWVFDSVIEAWAWMVDAGKMERAAYDELCAQSMSWLLSILDSYKTTYRFEVQ
jgi:hypothetical protein